MTATTSTPQTPHAGSNAPCRVCGFSLWIPVARLQVSDVGLYDDARFPGRTLLSLREHYTDLLDVPPDVSSAFVQDLRSLRDAVRQVTRAPRVNYAVLGNAEPHVHWHVIPRHPDREPLPHNSPWQDPRPRTKLSAYDRTRTTASLREALEQTG